MSWHLGSSLAKVSRIGNVALVFALGLLFGALFSGAESSKADTFAVMPPITNARAAETCTGPLRPKTPPENLDVTGACTVGAGTYVFKHVKIYGKADGTVKGSLAFADAPIDFWAESIIIENNGTLTAGVAPDGVTISPVGTNPGGKITIHLYGAQQSSKEHAVGVHCHDETCGVPSESSRPTA